MRFLLYIISVTLLASSLSAQTPMLPQWYTDWCTGMGMTQADYSLDTDGDGIPDFWERRTYGNPDVADGGIDRDGDGLTDLEEFTLGSDPRTASTMGDGWTDKEKADAGMDVTTRVTSALTLADWLAFTGLTAQGWHSAVAPHESGFTLACATYYGNTDRKSTRLNSSH